MTLLPSRMVWLRLVNVAARGGLDPEAELADLDGLLVQVHAVEVVLEDLPVEVEEGALAAQFLQPGVGESDVQAGVAFVNGAEQAAEVEPERVRVVGVAVLEGVLEGFGGQETAVFAEGAEQDPVQQLLGAAQDFGRCNGGVFAAKVGQDALADVGVEGVELFGDSRWKSGLDSTAICWARG